jgi:hypothetical protein
MTIERLDAKCYTCDDIETNCAVLAVPRAKITWDVVDCLCTAVIGTTGVYPMLSDCEEALSTIESCQESWNCINGNCIDPGNGSGYYNTLVDCQRDCKVTPSWNCVDGNCIDPGDESGTYTTLSACESECKLREVSTWTLVTGGTTNYTNPIDGSISTCNCVPVLGTSGQYANDIDCWTAAAANQLCGPVTTPTGWPVGVDCTKGIDAIFLVDYTSSMSPSVSAVKTGIASTVATIQSLMNVTSEYRLSLVLADESRLSVSSQYSNSYDYVALPAGQKVNILGVPSLPTFNPNYDPTRWQHYTAVEKFATNNLNTFQTQIDKIDTGLAPTGWPMGEGWSNPEPTDILLEMCIDTTNANYPFAGAWRANVAKYVFIYTDTLPSGNNDQWGADDKTHLNQLEAMCVANGIKVFVLGNGVNMEYSPGGGAPVEYPWRKFAEGTGGAWSGSFTAGTLNALITAGCE